MRNYCRGPSKHHSCIYWHSRFRGAIFFFILANQIQECLYVLAKFFVIKTKWSIFVDNWLNFIPAKFGSIGQLISEKNVKMWKRDEEWMTDYKWWQKLTWPLGRVRLANKGEDVTSITEKNNRQIIFTYFILLYFKIFHLD